MSKSLKKKKNTSADVVTGKVVAESPRNSGDGRLSQTTLDHRAQYVGYCLAALVSLVTFSAYLSSLRNEFVNWDDPVYVFENPHIHSFNVNFFKWAFFDFHAANWHPLTWMSHALDYAVWGLNPLGHHLTNNILHAANTFLVVLLAAKLVETASHHSRFTLHASRFTLIAAATTGLLFGLHPVHVESVAWIAERKDLLCALFFLLSVMVYTSYTTYKSPRTYLLSLCFFILALLSKPMAVTLPFVLLILDWYPFGRIQSIKSFRTAFSEKIPFIALSLVSSVLTILAQRAGGAMSMMESVPFSVRALVAAKSLTMYLWKMIWPMELIPYYPYPKIVLFFSSGYFPPLILAIGITTACVVMAKKQKVLLSAWGYYVATLLPVIGLVQVGGQAMADRYTYLPSLGPFLIVGLGAAWVSGKVSAVKKKDLFSAIVLAVTAVVLFVPLTSLTIKQIRIWKDSFSLWNYVIDKQPVGIPLAHTNRGLALANMGRLDKAIEDYNQAITLDPSDYKAYANRGTAFEKMERLDKAMEDFNRAIALNPVFFEAYNDRGSVLKKMGRSDKALEDFDKAIALNPGFDEAYYNRGIAYGEAGLLDQSIDSFNRALAIDPVKVDAYVSRGISYAVIGQQDRALEDFNKAISLNQKHDMAYYNRGNLYFITGKKELALSDFRKACDLGNQGGCDVVKRYGK